MRGIEWIIEAEGCSPAKLQDVATLRELFEAMICDLELHPVGEMIWHKFPSPGGVTAVWLLSESHLACHTFPEFGSVCLNLFCCQPRREWNYQEQLRHRLGAESVHVRCLERPYGTPVLSGVTSEATDL
jgi:S-adenosylmethionine decarboxylase